MNAKDPTPSQELHTREALAPVFDDLNKYAATMHFVGQSTILTLTNDRATGEAYTLAHHLTVDGAKRRLMIAALRYNDSFVKTNGARLVCQATASSTGSRSAAWSEPFRFFHFSRAKRIVQKGAVRSPDERHPMSTRAFSPGRLHVDEQAQCLISCSPHKIVEQNSPSRSIRQPRLRRSKLRA